MEEKRRSLKGMKGQYELLLPLARDRLADYYLALNSAAQGDDRFVVVREVLPEVSGDKERVSAFLSELRVTSRFTHSNLLRTLETGRTKISYFAIEEFLLGDGLGKLVEAARAAGIEMGAHVAVGLAAQVCDGLEYAHQLRDSKGNPLQAVHRNLSPTHIVVGYSGRVKVVDFDVNETAFQLVDGVTRGDLAYLSPEQVERQTPGPAADIFALATIVWELLAGRSLFRRETDLETRQAVLSAQVPPLERSRGVPGEFEAVLVRALQRNPRSRFQSAAQFGQALRDWLRQTGKEVGEYEIGVFVRSVLGDQEKKKRRLLEQAVKAELASGDIASLLPDRKTRLAFVPPAGAPGTRPPSLPTAKGQRPPSLPSLPPPPPPGVGEEPPRPEPINPAPPKLEPIKPIQPPLEAIMPAPAAAGGPGVVKPVAEAAPPPPPAPVPQAPPAAVVPTSVDVALGTFTDKSAPAADVALVTSPVAPAREPTPAPTAPPAEAPAAAPAPSTPPPVAPAAPAPAAPATAAAPTALAASALPPPSPAAEGRPRPDAKAASIRVRMPGAEGRKGPPWTAILLGISGALILAVVLFVLFRDRLLGPSGDAGSGGVVPMQQALLEVRSTPAGCQVTIDGRALDKVTPIDAEAVLPIVSHEVVVVCEGRERKVQTFQGGPGERVVLSFQFGEAADVGAAEPAPDAGVAGSAPDAGVASLQPDAGIARPRPDGGAVKPVPPKPLPPKPLPPAGGAGFLQINTLPWTEVWLGNKKLGITPLLGAKLPVGKHTIKLVNPEAKIHKTLEVTIQAGKTTSVFKQLQ